MPFCTQCGQSLAKGAKFCFNCGAPVEEDISRKQVFEGELRKCPHCGEPLKSFEAVCPVCGYELRGVAASKTTQQLAEEIAQIERTRPKQKRREKKKFFSNDVDEPDEIDKSIANLIQTFPIPNSKEDVIEFIVLAMSNADTEVLDSLEKNGANWAARNIISEAWINKLEQAYQKAKILFGESPEFSELQAMYEKKQIEIKKGRKKSLRFHRNFLIGLGICWVSFFALVNFASLMADIRDENYMKEEVQRLEGIYNEVQTEISNENYEVALMKVNNLYYIYRSDDEEYHSKDEDKTAQEWNTKREILLREIERAMNESEEGSQ